MKYFSKNCLIIEVGSKRVYDLESAIKAEPESLGPLICYHTIEFE